MTLTGIDPTTPDDRGTALYEELLRNAPHTGRCPIILTSDVLAGAGVVEPPDDPVAAIDALDPLVVLADWWPGGPCTPDCPCAGEMSDTEMPEDPAGPSFPDLSRAPETIATAASSVRGLERLSMIDAVRPADVPAVVGWSGICNYQPYQDLPRLSAVLRRWEERYGAMLVGIDRSRLHLTVAHPPRTDAECRRVAAEHFAFCPDQQDPQNGDFYTLGIYAGRVRGAGSWHFWWD